MALFTAFWPILDDTLPLEDLVAEASVELAEVAARARCTITGGGSWEIRPAAEVAGTGGFAGDVLLYEEQVAPDAVGGRRCRNCTGVYPALVDDVLCLRCDALFYPTSSWSVAS